MKVLLCSLWIFVLSLPFAHAEGKQRLTLAVQPTLATSEILEKSAPFKKTLQEHLGPEIEIEIYTPMSYAAVVEALRFGHADAALMGAWPARLAVRLAGAEIPLAEIREVLHENQKVEETFYYSYWIVPKDSPYEALEELRGKNVCFPNPLSSSGYVAPLGRLVELGLIPKIDGREADPGTFFGQVLFGGGYQQCWTALKHNQVDVSVIAGDVPEALYREVRNATRAIESQGPIPSHALVVSRHLEEPLRSLLINAVFETGRDRELMRSFVSGIFTGFEATTAERHLDGLKRYLELTELTFTERIG